MKLEGFITAEDARTVNLSKHDVKLEYGSAEVGTNKSVDIDSRHKESFFGLEGHNHALYQLDPESLKNTTIQSTIIPRPIKAVFYTVCKEYDGTAIFDKELLRYRFFPTGSAQSGLVMGSDNCYQYVAVDSESVELQLPEDSVGNYSVGDTWIFTGYEKPVSHSSQSPTYIRNPELKISASSDIPNRDYRAEWINHEKFNGSLTSFPVVFDRDRNEFYLKINEGLPMADVGNASGHMDDANTRAYPPYNLICQSGNDFRHGLQISLKMKLVTVDTESVSNPSGRRYTRSDIGRVLLNVERAEAPSKNVTNSPTLLRFFGATLVTGVTDDGVDVAKNYVLKDYYGYGHIYKRRCIVYVKCKSKVYDGTDKIEYQLDHIDRLIEGDDVYLDMKTPCVVWASGSVGEHNVPMCIHEPILAGSDSNNYSPNNEVIICNRTNVTIYKREVTFDLSILRIYRNNNKFEVMYNLHNVIGGDNVYLDFEECYIKGIRDDGLKFTLRGLFTNQNTVNSEAISWSWDSDGNEIGTIQVECDDGPVQLSNLSQVTLHGVRLLGPDSSNYSLEHTSYGPINIDIVHIC